MKIAIAASLLASAAAFAPAHKASSSVSALNAEMSQSMPFLTKPKNLDGYIGDVGFDPLGLATYFDIKWMRESELKHGRAAMLATVGFVVQQFFTLPGFEHVDDSNLAPSVVGQSPMLQIVFGLGVVEFVSNKGKVTMMDMFDDPDRVPGKLGFDPMGYYQKNSKEAMELLEYKELKNGRLAMLAIGGMIHHNFVTGGPLL